MTLVCSLRLGLGSRILLGASNMRHVWLRSLGLQWDCSWLLMLPFQQPNFGRRRPLSHPAWVEVVQVMISSTLTRNYIWKDRSCGEEAYLDFFQRPRGSVFAAALGRRHVVEDRLAQVGRTRGALAQLPAVQKLRTALVSLKTERSEWFQQLQLTMRFF